MNKKQSTEEFIENIIQTELEKDPKHKSQQSGVIQQKTFNKIIAIIGAGMSVESRLKLANAAIEHIEQRLILENVLGSLDASMKQPEIENELAGKSLVSRRNYEHAVHVLQQITQTKEPDFEMRMEALCQGG
jgi:Flp pilus assembly protein TadD